MEENRAAAAVNDQAPEPGLVGRPISVFTIDDGPDNSQLWKKTMRSFIRFHSFSQLMLLIKSLTC